MSQLRIELSLRRAAGFRLDVQCELPLAGVTAIVGPSGAGKSTLLRAVAGLEPAARGRLEIDGEVWQGDGESLPPQRRRVGVVFQDAGLFPHLDVAANLEYPRQRLGRAPGLDLDATIAQLGIGGLLERRPSGLSGGERRRVALARALAAEPRLLLLDEPLTALDEASRRAILGLLSRVLPATAPTLLVSHRLDEVLQLADRVVVLEAGKVVDVTAPAALARGADGLEGEAGSLFEGTVEAAADPELMALRVGEQVRFLVPAMAGAIGTRRRLRVLARDVAISLDPPGRTSVLNVLAGRVSAVDASAVAGAQLVRIALGDDAELSAMVTARSVGLLGLAPGVEVHAMVKAAALAPL